MERLWRKNLRDNNIDGQIASATASTPTGTSRTSSTGTRRVRPSFVERDLPRPVGGVGAGDDGPEGADSRSTSPSRSTTTPTAVPPLYPNGWQIGTPSARRPDLPRARREPRQPGDPGLQRRASRGRALRHERRLRPTSRTADRAARLDARAERGLFRLRVRVPRRRDARSSEFETNLPFALCVASSAADPAAPVSYDRPRRRSPSTCRATTRTRRACRSRTSRSPCPTGTRRWCASLALRARSDRSTVR